MTPIPLSRLATALGRTERRLLAILRRGCVPVEIIDGARHVDLEPLQRLLKRHPEVPHPDDASPGLCRRLGLEMPPPPAPYLLDLCQCGAEVWGEVQVELLTCPTCGREWVPLGRQYADTMPIAAPGLSYSETMILEVLADGPAAASLILRCGAKRDCLKSLCRKRKIAITGEVYAANGRVDLVYSLRGATC